MAITRLTRPNQRFFGWTIFRPLVLVDDFNLAADEFNQSLQRLEIIADANDVFAVVNVASYDRIRIMVYGTAVNNDTATMALFGWYGNGPASRIATVTCTLGNSVMQDIADSARGFHTEPQTDESIRNVFLATADYFAVDTFAVTSDYEASVTARNSLVDTPAHLDLDLSGSQYTWIAALFTGLGATPLMSSVAAIYRPISVKGNMWELTGGA